VLHGELHDSCKEFFVGCKSASSQPGSIGNMWLDTYYMRPAMLPTFLSRALAERALVIGKSINFIRLCIHKCPKSRSVKMKVRGQVCQYEVILHPPTLLSSLLLCCALH
jgi:Gamma tubulin complex component N-terminal